MGGRIEKKGAAAFACFGGPPASDAAAEQEEDGRRRKQAKSLSWSRFWGKKKTVPLPVDVTTHEADEPEKISADKKGLRQIFCKSSSTRRQDKGSAGTSTEHHLNRRPSPEGFGTKPARPPNRATEKTNTGKSRIKRNSGAGSSNAAQSATFGRDRSRKGKHREANVEALLAMVAVMLVALLLGGRVVAILCTAACFYMLPSLNATILNDRRMRISSGINVPSERHMKVAKLPVLSERNGRRILSG